jgi:hypothetical protein
MWVQIKLPKGTMWISHGTKRFTKKQMKYLEKQIVQGIKKNSHGTMNFPQRRVQVL